MHSSLDALISVHRAQLTQGALLPDRGHVLIASLDPILPDGQLGCNDASAHTPGRDISWDRPEPRGLPPRQGQHPTLQRHGSIERDFVKRVSGK